MEITCLQMDVLISFYIDEELSDTLKEKVEEHLRNCAACRAKLNIIKSLFPDYKDNLKKKREEEYDKESYNTTPHTSRQYQFFKNNLSAYVDNELSGEESVKMKKYTITNKKARQELEDTIRIRKLMQDSFKKSEAENKIDFSKPVIKQTGADVRNDYKFNSLIIIGFAFIMTVLIISALVLYALSLN